MELFGSKLARLWSRCKFLSPRVSRKNSDGSASSSPISSAIGNDKPSSLYKRISLAGDPKLSMASILDQWVSEGHQICSTDLQHCITRLRHFKRFSHALQVSTWMTEKHSSNLKLKDVAIQLELISKVHGLDLAEKHFINIPESLRGPVVYNALLNCYAKNRSMKKAEDLMQKLRNMGFAGRSVPYNIMLKMYFQLEMYDKAEQILQEMEKRGFNEDTFTYRIRLAAYSNSGKVKEMESVLMKMEADPLHSMNFADYITAANGYLTGGDIDKSLVMLRRAEHLARGKDKKHCYHCLLTLYAHAKVKEEVYRIWDLYKRSWNVYNKGHRCMVSALVILDDLEGAEKIIDEWTDGLSADEKVDFQIINPLVRGYCKKGDLERAQALVDKLRGKTCQEPQRSTWEILVVGYCLQNQMENAVKTMKAALVADGSTWKLNKVSLSRCLEFLRMQGNADELQEYTNLLEKYGYSAENLLSEVQSGSGDMVEEEDTDMVTKRTD